LASWEEVVALTNVMADLGTGIFQIARENVIADDAEREIEHNQIKNLAIETGVPVTFGGTWYKRPSPDAWRSQFRMVDETIAAGGKIMIQATAAWNGSLRSFETATPYDFIAVWKEFRQLPLEEQEKGLRDPVMRKKLVDAVSNHVHKPDPSLPNLYQRPVDWDWVFPYDRTLPPFRTINEVAAERGVAPIDAFIDLALEHHFKLFFIQPSFNDDQDYVLAHIRHPNSVVTFSDAGAHVATTCSPIHGHLLGHWVRNAQAIPIETAIRKVTFDIASFWGLKGRGWLHEGYHADIVVFDPETIAPGLPALFHDLPSGAARIKQKTDGIKATIVNGQVLMRNNEHTGAYPGQVLRGPLAHN
jgi:N-acyl-D-aspartate/D-glutamate deacylase